MVSANLELTLKVSIGGDDWNRTHWWWKSFINDYRTRHGLIDGHGYHIGILSHEILNQELAKYHAVYGNSALYFESEKYFNWFLLRWS